ncbi:MAG: hypothetical protein ACI8W7_004525 [Gammaproteobacteria bacterium]|jgi:hypothetical protein
MSSTVLFRCGLMQRGLIAAWLIRRSSSGCVERAFFQANYYFIALAVLRCGLVLHGLFVIRLEHADRKRLAVKITLHLVTAMCAKKI